jgi:hypothetical protein
MSTHLGAYYDQDEKLAHEPGEVQGARRLRYLVLAEETCLDEAPEVRTAHPETRSGELVDEPPAMHEDRWEAPSQVDVGHLKYGAQSRTVGTPASFSSPFGSYLPLGTPAMSNVGQRPVTRYATLF